MKKICSITTIPNSMRSFMIPEAVALYKYGWKSVIISSFNPSDIKSIPDEIPYYSVPMERTYNIKVAIRCILQLYRIFRKEKFDIVQYGTTHAALFGSIASFLARIPNRIFLQWGPTGYNDFKGLKRFLTKSIETMISTLSTTIRPVSHKNLEASVKDGLYPKHKASVVGKGGTIGVNLEEYPIEKRQEYSNKVRGEYNLSESDFLFGFIGRISKQKGIQELLSAFKVLADTHPVKLMIIGSDESNADIPLLEWARNNPSIIFTGRVEHYDIPQYLAALNVLVHPTYREGFGMVLQEAMAIGTPIITTDIPGPSEVIEENISGMLVRPEDVESLSRAMKSLYDNPEILQRFSRDGRIRVEKYFDRKIRLQLLVNDKNQILEGQKSQ